MRLGDRGKALIHKFEACRLVAYKPTSNDVWTIGWGHTKGVGPGLTCIKAQADAWFDEDVLFAEEAVSSLDVPLTQSMYDALVSLVYNCGPSPIQPGKTIGNALRKSDYDAAAEGFHLWVKQAGITLSGLARRRNDEVSLFWEDGLPAES